MQQESQDREDRFAQPLGLNFIVALKARNGEFCLFFKAFTRKNGKSYMEHTTDISEAHRMSRLIAEDVAEEVKEYRCFGRVERVSADNSRHTPVQGGER
jgi:hypothetical protein